MAVGVKEETESKGGLVLYFPANDDEDSSFSSSTSPRLPRRLRLRLKESRTPSTAEEIQAKLQLADLRRQAKRQRAGCLMQRRRTCDIAGAYVKGMPRQDYLSTIIARCWREFSQVKKTTFALVKAFQALDITGESVKSIEFELLASQINAATTIQTVKALLDRLESHYTILRTISGNVLSMNNVDHLLKHIGSHSRTRRSNQVTKTSRSEVISSRKAAKGPIKQSRYPAKVVLFAYMILGHPDTVFIGRRECVSALLESALNFVRELELLIKIILKGPLRTHHEGESSTPLTFRSQLEMFDKRWCSYLHHFVVWKDKDAIFFKENMIGVARQLEFFMMQTSKLALEGDDSNIAHDVQAHDKKKIRTENLQRPELRSSESNTVCSPESRGLLISLSAEMNNLAVCSVSLIKNDHFISANVVERLLSSSETLVSGNELIANELVHEHHDFLSVTSKSHSADQNSLEVKVKEVMERAFWDGIMESMERDEPDFNWVMKVLTEVRDELCQMSPPSWSSEITEKLDVKILVQVLNSGTLDVDYFRKLLEFTLVTLQKLSAPAKEREMGTSYEKLMEELGEVSCFGEKSKASFALLVVKGLRFVLHQIQNLKEEIANASLWVVEPLIKGPAGLEYLKTSFSKRWGSPTDALTCLPLTRQWLSSVWAVAEQEWNEYTDSVFAIINNARVHQGLLPTTIRTGGNILMPSNISATSSVTGFHAKEQPECKGERLDLLIRVGLLKLVNQIRGLTNETLPETLKLNLTRLKNVQSLLQRIIVISVSLLVVRQILVDENLVSSPGVENILSTCSKHLCKLLDTIDDAGLPEIVEVLCGVFGDRDSNPEKLHARKQIMSNMLIKSLQEGDTIYARVSHNVYVAARGVVLGGSRTKGRQLVEAALWHIGAGALTDKVVEAAEPLVVMAGVSVFVHEDWYRELMKVGDNVS